MTQETDKAIEAYWHHHPEATKEGLSAMFGFGHNYVSDHTIKGLITPPDGYKPRVRNKSIDWEAVNAYWHKHPGIRQTDLAKAFGCYDGTISRAITSGRITRPDKTAPSAQGGEQTMMTATKPDTIHATEAHIETAAITPTKERTCSHCGATLVPGARYCHICGTQYIDPRELCIRALEKLAQNISTFYPRTARDNAIAQITMIREYIESTCEEV